MQAVFTIVAKNYIPLANILGDSLKQHHPELSFFIIVADREDGLIQYSQQRYTIIAAEDLSIERLPEMAFKYNITEFCTSIKPFCFRYFFNEGFEKIIYLDPDIYIFNRLDSIFSALDNSSMVLTPHFCTIEEVYSGISREGNALFAGIFNLGFCALKYNTNGLSITNWWCNRLADLCYADRTDGLHVDQKWADFLPIFFDDIHIEKGLGYNMAIWNWHERKLIYRNNNFFVSNRIIPSEEEPLIFYHFSNYRFKLAKDIKEFIPVQIERLSDVKKVSEFYANLLLQEDIASQLSKLAYSYATFDNGVPIVQFHRRFYRRLVETEQALGNPFEADSINSFFGNLKKNNLLVKNKNLDKLNEANFEGFDRKLSLLNKASGIIKMLLGFERYAILCKFMHRYVRPENQVFLMKGYNKEMPFVNENRYINTK